MYGLSPKQKTPRIVLKKPGPKFIFMRDSTNTFSVTAQNFPEITSIDMEVCFLFMQCNHETFMVYKNIWKIWSTRPPTALHVSIWLESYKFAKNSNFHFVKCNILYSNILKGFTLTLTNAMIVNV